MKKILAVFLVAFALLGLASCSSNHVAMPYGTEEYKSGEWTEESLVKHLEELGFENIEITNVIEEFGEEEWKIHNIKIEDPDSNSWFASYRAFDKDEKFDKDSRIIVETYVSHPTISIDNSENFRKLVNSDNVSVDDSEVSKFFESHNGEYIEFNGLITYCNDSLFYVNFDLYFDVKIENSSWFVYSWDNIKISNLHECGWHIDYNSYSVGTLGKGDSVHMVCQIVALGDSWSLVIKQFETK